MRTSTDPKCRMCAAADETVVHLLTGCSTLAGKEYVARHNEVAKIIHRNICTEFGIPVHKQHWIHEPQSVTDTEDAKILWDFDIQTDRRIQARRPDIVLVEKQNKKATLIDIAVYT